MLARTHTTPVRGRDERSEGRRGVFGDAPASLVRNAYLSGTKTGGRKSVAVMNSTDPLATEREVTHLFSAIHPAPISVALGVARTRLSAGPVGVNVASGTFTRPLSDVERTWCREAYLRASKRPNFASRWNLHDTTVVAAEVTYNTWLNLLSVVHAAAVPDATTRLVEPEADIPQRSAWQILRELSGTVEGPEDWASEADHYLYGTPKRRAAPDEE